MIGNPIPATTWRECGGYDADSGLDIMVATGTACVAAADGVIEYAEHGHTPWGTVENVGIDTPNSVRLRLAQPIVQDGVTYRWVWYTHLSAIDVSIRDKFEVPIRAGAPIGRTGVGNKVPHLHFGVLADREQTITMPWRQVATLIWGEKNGVAPVPPVHPPIRRVKMYQHDSKRTIVVNGESYPIRRLLVNGMPFTDGEIVAEY